MRNKASSEDGEYLSSEEVRSYFKWRVYFFLLIQLVVATCVVWSIFNFRSLHTILHNNLDVLYIAEITAILCLFMLTMFEEVRCDSPCGSPVNLVTLGIYSIALAIHSCGTVYLYSSDQIGSAVLITAFTFTALSKAAIHTSHDFFVAGGNAVMLTFIFRFASYLFSDYTLLVFTFKILNFLSTCVDIICDTQALRFVNCEDYVLSCANLYFNILHMFQCTLALMPIRQDSSSLVQSMKGLVSWDASWDYLADAAVWR